MLIVFSGLPGVGKTTIARELARAIGGVHVRIDSIERALQAGGWRVEGEGYAVARAVADDNLRLGRVVIADCVNPWPATRLEWRSVADRAGVPAMEIEVVCSDVDEHRRRVEARLENGPGERFPTWLEVIERDYLPWTSERIVIDTARMDVEECLGELLERARMQGYHHTRLGPVGGLAGPGNT